MNIFDALMALQCTCGPLSLRYPPKQDSSQPTRWRLLSIPLNVDAPQLTVSLLCIAVAYSCDYLAKYQVYNIVMWLLCTHRNAQLLKPGLQTSLKPSGEPNICSRFGIRVFQAEW